MLRAITGGRAGTPITHILTGIAGPGGTATGAIVRELFRVPEPRNLRAKTFYRNFITLT